MLNEAAVIGARNVFANSSDLPVTCTKAEAYRYYGRSDVDRWIAEGLIIPLIKKGKVSKKCIDKVALERIAASSNRITYLPVADR